MKPPHPRLVVFLIVLLDVMGFGLIIPSQPFLAKNFGASTATVTLLGTIYSLMQFILAPVWGSLSDRIGRRPVLIATITITAIGHATFSAATSLAMLFLARALAGIGAANISTAQAVLADTNPAAERSRAMALIGAAFGLGFIFGPAFGGILFHLDHRAPAAFGASLALLNLLLVSTTLPETRSLETINSNKHRRFNLRELGSIGPKLRQLVFTTLLFITAFALMEQSVGLFIERYWINPSDPGALEEATSLTSLFLVVVGISATIAQGFLVRKWLKSNSEAVLFRYGLGVVACAMLAIPALGLLGIFSLFLLTAVALALGSGMFNPSMLGLVSLASPEDKQGFGLAVNQSAAALGRILGPTSAGMLFSLSPHAPFLVAAGLTLVALLVSRNVCDSRGQKVPQG